MQKEFWDRMSQKFPNNRGRHRKLCKITQAPYSTANKNLEWKIILSELIANKKTMKNRRTLS